MFKSTSIAVIIFVAVVVSIPACPLARAAEEIYPAKPIRLVVGFSPGGGSDLLARSVSQKLSENWGKPVVVDNRSGAGGTIAMDIVAHAAADGYTLLVISGSQVTNASLFTKVAFDIGRAFAPITQMTSQPYVMLVHSSVGARTVRDLIAAARKTPGRINYASSGTGSSAHLGMELFKQLAGVDMVHVPYKGSGAALRDLLGGQVQVLLASAISAAPYIKGGRLRALGVTSARRSPSQPELPTIAEAGVPGFDVTGWYGLVAPKAVPTHLVMKLNRELGAILASTEFRRLLGHEGAEARPSTPQDFGNTISDEIRKWQKVVESSGIKLD